MNTYNTIRYSGPTLRAMQLDALKSIPLFSRIMARGIIEQQNRTAVPFAVFKEQMRRHSKAQWNALHSRMYCKADRAVVVGIYLEYTTMLHGC